MPVSFWDLDHKSADARVDDLKYVAKRTIFAVRSDEDDSKTPLYVRTVRGHCSPPSIRFALDQDSSALEARDLPCG